MTRISTLWLWEEIGIKQPLVWLRDRSVVKSTAAPAESLGSVPITIWAAQGYRKSGSRGSDTLFRPFQARLHTPASTHIRNVKEYTKETAEPSLNITGSQKFVLKTVSLRNNSAI